MGGSCGWQQPDTRVNTSSNWGTVRDVTYIQARAWTSGIAFSRGYEDVVAVNRHKLLDRVEDCAGCGTTVRLGAARRSGLKHRRGDDSVASNDLGHLLGWVGHGSASEGENRERGLHDVVDSVVFAAG